MSTHAPHPFQPDDPEPASEHEFLGVALRQLLIEKGIYSADDEREQIEAMQAANPGNGARIVAKAWTDPAYAKRLLRDADSAIAELGYDAVFPLIVLANSPEVHHVVVCTLCSCYPRALLGPQPAWYKSGSYRSRVVREPRKVLQEFGLEVASNREVRVHDSTAELRYMVLPMRPTGTEGMSEEQLAELVSRDSLIGVAEARPAAQ